MREIKFRAWDKRTKKMEEVVEIYVADQPVVIYIWAGEHTDRMDVVHPSEYELMQFTGLHDKAGKEIYEDDIVKFYDCLSGLEYTGVVGFSDGSFCIESEWARHFRWMDYDVWIMGNKFENPDLVPEGMLEE